jgi:hypothetical protein
MVPGALRYEGLSQLYFSPVLAECIGHRNKSRDPNMGFDLTDKPIDLAQHRGIAAQPATELRRLELKVEIKRAAQRLTISPLLSKRSDPSRR